MEISSWIWAVLAAFATTIYFFLIKYYTQKNKIIILILAVLLDFLVIYLYYKSLIHTKSGIMNAIINGLSVILGAIIATLFFKEEMTLMDIAGIIIIIIGIVMVR